jgi:nicotinate-nucleotide adenylyltransferase
MTMAVGVMGGTFDPIHIGHLIAAEEVLFGYGLERIVFVPCGVPPHKPSGEVAGAVHRHEMTVLATSGHPQFEVSAVEISRPGPSYTVDTMAEMADRYGPNARRYFITGLDAVLELTTWKDYRRLLGLCEIIAVTRPGYRPERLVPLTSSLGKQAGRVHLFPVTAVDISSSKVRQRVREGRSIRYLVPDAVRDYVLRHRLYGVD